MDQRRVDSDEFYILVLVSGSFSRSVWGHGKKLPIDGYFPKHRLIVEYHERQHNESVPIIERRMTVNGVCRVLRNWPSLPVLPSLPRAGGGSIQGAPALGRAVVDFIGSGFDRARLLARDYEGHRFMHEELEA